MSDYGFKTMDKSNAVALNAKHPIFGFDMAHMPRAFKTFRITDTKQATIRTGSVATPNPNPTDSWGYDENMDYGVVRELVKKVEHGYDFRPVGYATITGNLKCSCRVQIQQTQRAGNYGGNYTRTFTKDQAQETLTPSQNGHIWFPYTDPNIAPPGGLLDPTDFSGTNWAYPYPKQVLAEYIPYGPMWQEPFAGFPDPIEVEIDDKYIYFYRTYWWSDTIRRCKFTYGGSTSDDIQERVKFTTQFVGSVYNITVYLCPYPIEELL